MNTLDTMTDDAAPRPFMPSPDELTRARLMQLRREFGALHNRMSELLQPATVASDDLCVWIAALERCARECREASTHAERHILKNEAAAVDAMADARSAA